MVAAGCVVLAVGDSCVHIWVVGTDSVADRIPLVISLWLMLQLELCWWLGGYYGCGVLLLFVWRYHHLADMIRELRGIVPGDDPAIAIFR